MKTFIKTLALALTLGAASFSTVHAAVEPDKKTRPETFASYQTAIYPSSVAPVVNVIVAKEEGSPVQIHFKTKNGETLVTRTVGAGKDKVAMKFRIDELPDGVYIVEVTNGRDVTKKEVKLATQPEVNPRTIVMQ